MARDVVARSGFYAWPGRAPPARQQTAERLKVAIKVVREIYGVRRLQPQP